MKISGLKSGLNFNNLQNWWGSHSPTETICYAGAGSLAEITVNSFEFCVYAD